MPYKDPAKKRLNDKRYQARNREKLAARSRAWRQRNPDKVRAMRRAYALKHPYTPEKMQAYAESMKRYAALHPEKVRAYKRAHWHKHKARYVPRVQAYKATHPDQLRAQEKAYRIRHPDRILAKNASRRARLKSAPINDLTAAQWREIKEAYDNRCVYCGRKMKRLSQDHIIPLSKGGSHTVSNVVPACLRCNITKSAGPPPIPVQPLLLTVAQGGKLA